MGIIVSFRINFKFIYLKYMIIEDLVNIFKGFFKDEIQIYKGWKVIKRL